ncbi:hypothetical protein O159_02770 [Leifsonia xyli subsp. cynodontis DSM 46306]|uniref:Uncharacterized protein n=1 Tax=Leifsonia xyli subsp. cynodontis DSM 46306 TaxID=1389489 RepID=U3P437_LEIXC|nr:hypothetical protein [Leifsonia xyli]AGW40506.1 hypothetical protein O159_02770 [Leifsonia xyli subsp. cynodontis DSM 46306]
MHKRMLLQGKARSRRGLITAITGMVLVAGSVLVTAAPANAVVVGVCTMQVQDPHPSTHVHGTINVVGTASCSIVMTEIYVKVTLQRSDDATWPGATNDYRNTSQEQANAAAPCSAGPNMFRGYLSYALTAPAGYSPAYATGTTYGIWKSVICGGPGLVAPNRSTDNTAAKKSAALTVKVPIYQN